jgi:hypothetical protein
MTSQILFSCVFEPGEVSRIADFSAPIRNPIFAPIVEYLPEFVLLVLILAIPIAFLASLALLGLYRRAVLRSMRARKATAPPQGTTSLPIPPAPPESPTPHLNITMLDSDPAIRGGGATSGLYTSLQHAPWRAAAIYSLAGLGFAIVMTFAYLSSGGIPLLPLTFITVLWIFIWPIIPTVNFVIAATWRIRLVITLGYFVLYAALGIVIVMANPAYHWGGIELAWLSLNLPAIILLAVFLNRRIRAVSPLVLIITILGLSGAVLAFTFVANNLDLFSTAFEINAALGLGGYAVIETIIIGFVVFGLAGWLVIRWLGGRYKKKKLSDQSITIGAQWLVYGILQSTDIMIGNDAWFFAGILAFAVFASMAWTGFRIFPFWKPSAKSHPSLLLLRVFSLGKRSEQFFDVIGTYWRYIGHINLIAGPDLLNTTVEPHEFLDFLSGKLARRFIADSQTLDLRFREMDLKPDHDGRFRVNDFFCHDDTWKTALTRLVSTSDIVLMDLRGFAPQNAGCIFEISALIDSMPLQRVVFIIDDTTDESFLRQTFQTSWDGMSSTSPNRMPGGFIRVLRLKQPRNRDIQQVFHALTLAVEGN